MMQMSALTRNLLVAAVVVVIGLVAYFSVIQPKLNQVAQSEAQLDSLKQEFADLKRVADQKPLYLALTRQIQQRLTGVELTADPRAYVPTYLKQIEDLAKRDGLTVTSVVPAPQPSPSPSASPGATPNPQSVQNAPLIGAPIKAAARVAGAENANTQTANQVAEATGATPLPGAGVAPPTAAAPAAKGSPTQGGAAPPSARESAIAYVNQSFTQVPINMELEGTFAQFERFLRDLNKFPKLLGVGNVTMTPVEARVGVTPTLRITLPIVAYRLSPGAAPPGGPQAQPSPAPSGGS